MFKFLIATIFTVAVSVVAWETELDTNIAIDVQGGDTTFTIRKSWLLAREAELTADSLYDEAKHTIRKFPNEEVQ